ncbi:conjugal transfer protein [Rhizobium terrae]|uniref:conjugal transfer protein n=1 Tax=Rhizobium terrae TaxID=2171756 RepID=UPI000E3B85A4|nr:conjugal transfer protein [Rhizobium terrae]
MKKLVLIVSLLSITSPALAQVPVIDNANLKVAEKTSRTTDEILETNKQVLKTAEETLKAVTGNRAGEASPMQKLAVGDGFSVSQMPPLDSLVSSETVNFGAMKGDAAQVATRLLNGLQLVKNLSGKNNSGYSGDKSYEELVKTVLGVAALVAGSHQAVQNRRVAFERAGASIGQSQDIKGSIDQNTQLQVQAGMTINELIGVMNGAVSSLQADNQRRLTDMSNSKKALSYQDE